MVALWELFLIFAKIGLFTFGGGLAMISLIENKCVEEKRWITHEEMMDITVIAESTPGPIAINCATYVGYKRAGFLGSVFATLGVVLPSFVIIYAISVFLDNFLELTVIANAFKGIKIAVGFLILDAGFNMVKKMQKKPLSVFFVTSSFLVMLVVNIFSLNFSSVSLIIIVAALSFMIHAVSRSGGKSK